VAGWSAVKALARRLDRLEASATPIEAPRIRLFWDEELVPCVIHASCGVEAVSGSHHSPLIRLHFTEADNE
jgi:hypothetical protein